MKIVKAVLKTLVVISNQVKEAKLVVGPQHHIGAMDLDHGGWLRVDPYPPDPKWPPVLIPPVNILIVTPDPKVWERPRVTIVELETILTEEEEARAHAASDTPNPGLPTPAPVIVPPDPPPQPERPTVIVPPDPPAELGGALGAPPAKPAPKRKAKRGRPPKRRR